MISKIVGEQPELKPEIKELIPKVKALIQEINSLTEEARLRLVEAEFPELLEKPRRKVEERHLPPLRNAEEGKVVTRFPPEPNGYPHIGHAKAVVIDETYARMYGGRLILRFDDTNPAKEKIEYYNAIRDGLSWLGVKPDLEKNTSDDMELLYRYAERLISDGSAYACTCQPAVIKQNRAAGAECSCRQSSVEENLVRWRKMFKEYRVNDAVLRLKGDMKSLNTSLRDPTFFRMIDVKHPLKGDRYRVWPTYDFVAPIEDSLDGVTHALRTKEYELRDELYFLILKLLNLRPPELIEFSRLEIKDTPISKRLLQPLVNDGLVKGWDDPRLPTLTALRRRGFLPEAIREFVLSLGVSKAESEPDWSLLESVNRKMLDASAKRFFFVPNPVRLEVEDAPHVTARLKYHPEQDLGERKIDTQGVFYIPGGDAEKLRIGDTTRLLGLYNVKIDSSTSSRLTGSYAGDELKEDSLKIQWVTEDHVEFTVWVLGPLLVDGAFNKDSLKAVQGYAEEAAGSLCPDDKVQFVRFGFCRIDLSGVAILTHK